VSEYEFQSAHDKYVDREFAVRLARYCARNPVALSRLEYQSDNTTVTYHSDKPTGPTAGQSECAGQLRVVRLRSSATSRQATG